MWVCRPLRQVAGLLRWRSVALGRLGYLHIDTEIALPGIADDGNDLYMLLVEVKGIEKYTGYKCLV